MAAALKDLIHAGTVRDLAAVLARVAPGFARERFVADATRGLDGLELTARGRHIAEALHRHLPADFARAAELLTATLGEAAAADGSGVSTLRYLPHVYFVASHGLDDFEAAMRFQKELTRRFTAEFSIRPFLERYPERTLAVLTEWAGDPDVHVRRLVSEGTRPRLPWAARLRAFQRDPTPVLALLERLKDDAELYVRRSVANNLNDIGKDHPDLLVEVCRRWSEDASEERRWIVRHALRSLVKRGHRGALALFGCADQPAVRIERARFSSRRPARGETLEIDFDLVSTSARAQTLLADYVVHFIKANGKAAPKVFKLRRVALPAGARAHLSGRVSFADLTTRRHHAGVHRIDVLVNGVSYPLGSVRLT